MNWFRTTLSLLDIAGTVARITIRLLIILL